ncbi:MAG: prepilin-type N-terminal cleavage/methylation domain-containing protein [Candidatus Omnitrophota bacterium]
MPGRKGFTLLEVLLAIMLFSAGVVTLLQVVNTALFAGGLNENEIIAANLLQEKIEELRNEDFAGINSEDPPVAVDGFPGFTRGVTATTPRTGLREVSVTVYWHARNDRMSVNAATYVSDT